MTNGDKMRERLARLSNSDLAELILRNITELLSCKTGQCLEIADKNKSIIDLEEWLEEEAE